MMRRREYGELPRLIDEAALRHGYAQAEHREELLRLIADELECWPSRVRSRLERSTTARKPGRPRKLTRACKVCGAIHTCTGRR